MVKEYKLIVTRCYVLINIQHKCKINIFLLIYLNYHAQIFINVNFYFHLSLTRLLNPLLLKIEHMVKLQVFGNNSKTVSNIKNLTWGKNDQHIKIYLPCKFTTYDGRRRRTPSDENSSPDPLGSGELKM
jgi:hypothetical protein